MKDVSNASYVLGIQIYRDHRINILGLSEKGYIKKLLQRYSMHDYFYTLIAKGAKLNLINVQRIY